MKYQILLLQAHISRKGVISGNDINRLSHFQLLDHVNYLCRDTEKAADRFNFTGASFSAEFRRHLLYLNLFPYIVLFFCFLPRFSNLSKIH